MKTDRTVPSTRKTRHSGDVRVWASQLQGADMTRLPAKRRNKFFLDSYGRYTPELDPQLLNAATQVERNRIAALIELQEGPARHLQ